MNAPALDASGRPFPCYLVQGSTPEDAGLVGQELRALVDSLASAEGGACALEEYAGAGLEEDLSIAPVLDACRTPPLFAAARVVVVSDASRLSSAQVGELLDYLASPLESTVLVLAFPGRPAPAPLARRVREVGVVVDAGAPSGARRRAWFDEHLSAAAVRLEPPAAALLQAHLGEDLDRLEGLLASLEAAFGPGATIAADELEPFLGEAGGVAPWELTDAIDRGDLPGALEALDRLLGAGGRAPLALVATLHRHYGAMLRLDGAEVPDERAAAALTRLSPFPARKALEQARRLGHEGVADAIRLLAAADLDLRGRSGLPPEAVLEILVARLADRNRRAARGREHRAARRVRR
ncbi:MAG TPA: DNA polymerase III subunit delta [Acidimicrobiales bacterium]|nr:DNA polymerase III subunit delta [Acidimicrobiales bacterium]